MSRRRIISLVGSLAVAVPLAVVTTTPTTAQGASAAPAPASAVVLDWEETAFAVIYPPPPATPSIPLGVPYLGFTSLAMHHAVTASLQRRTSSEAAAAAVAAHDVLAEYFPAAAATLDGQLTESLAGVPDGKAEDVGMRIGRRTADQMIANRVGDGRELAGKVVYQQTPAIGVWQPPSTGMAAAHLGYVDRLIMDHRVPLDGPDALDSEEYAEDYNEVKELGSNAAPADAEAEAQQATATFFNFNSATMVGQATIEYLRENPMGIRRTALLFAAMHGAMTDSVIQAWRLKYAVGFWRPVEAIAQAAADGNPDTAPDPTWVPLLPTPPYSDYVSGHASLTAPAVQVVRMMLGERTELTLVNSTTGETRTYERLRALEREAFNARIWGGLHFRDAMEDGYLMGHLTANGVMRALGAL